MSAVRPRNLAARLATVSALALALGLALAEGALSSGAAPVPNAGVSITVSEDTLTAFNGTATDAESDPLTFTWQFPGPHFVPGADVEFSFPDPGSFQVSLWVSDGTSNESDDITVEVLDITAPTVVITGAPTLLTDEDTPFTVDGGSSFDNVAIMQFYWTVHDVDTTQNFDTASFSYTWATPGTYLVTLAATDDAANTGSGSAYVEVADTTAPTAVFTMGSPFEEDSMQVLDGGDSTDNVGIVSFTWTLGDAAGPSTRTGSLTSYMWTTPGTYTVTLTAADAAGNEGTLSASVTVLDVTPPNAVVAVPAPFNEDTEQTLDGSLSSDNIGVASWLWSVARVGGADALEGATVLYTWPTPGTYAVTLTVADAAGNSATDVATVTVLDITPPTAVISAPERFKVETVQTLDGTGSSDNAGIDDYEWALLDGSTTVVLVGATATYAWNVPGVYLVTLTVTDGAGLVGTASLTVTALENVPPTAVIEVAPSFAEDLLQTLDGSGSTDNVGVVSWTWQVQDELGTATLHGAAVQRLWTAPGTYTVTLTVADAADNIGSASTQVTVLDVTPPLARFTPPASVGNVVLTLDGSASSDNVGVVSFAWLLEDIGSTVEGAGSTLSYTWMAPGTFALALTVADAAGNTDTLIVDLLVIDTTAPLAVAGPDQTLNQDAVASFDATGSRDNDPNFPSGASFLWAFADVGGRSLEGPVATYRFHNPGVFQITLTVTDAAGNSGVDGLIVTVLDTEPPAAVFSLPYTVLEDDPQTLDGTLSLDNVAVVSWAWTVGGAGFSTALSGASVAFTFETPGLYTVTLVVSDAAGNSGSKAVSVLVLDITPPSANAGADLVASENQRVTFDARASSDNSPDFASVGHYMWFFSDAGAPRSLEGALAEYTFTLPGTYSVALLVVDGSGNFGMDVVDVTVLDTTPPTASALGGPAQSFPEDVPVTFDATPSLDNDPGFASSAVFTWTIGGSEDLSLSGRVVTHIFAAPGVYPVSLEARDLAGNTGTFDLELTIADTTAPRAQGNVASVVDEDTPLAMNGTLSSDNVGVVAWQWTVTDTGEVATVAGPSAEYTWTTPGMYLVTLTVQDEAGLVGTTGFSIHVRDTTAPVGIPTWNPSFDEGGRATFSSQGFTDNDPSFATTRVDRWTFDQQGVFVELLGTTVSHIFASPGTYTIHLSVADASGNAYLGNYDLAVNDVTAPWLTVLSPADGALLSARQAVVTGHFEPGAFLYINGVVIDNLGSFAERLTLVEGINVVEFQVRDASGNRVSKSLTLRVDSQAPALTIVEPPAGSFVREDSVRIEGRALDGQSVDVTVNGELRPVGGDGAFWALVRLDEGLNIIEIVAVDAAGHRQIAKHSVVRDTRAPTALVRLEDAPAVAGVPTTTAPSVGLAGRVEPGATVVLRIEHGAGVNETTPVTVAADGTFRVAVPLAPSTRTWFSVTTTDPAGNSVTEVFGVAQVPRPGSGVDPVVWGGSALALVAAVALTLALMLRPRRGRPQQAPEN